MSIERKTVEKLAHLARLKLSEEHITELQNDLGQILTWIDKLDEVDTEDVEPLLSMSHEINSWRKDEQIEHLPHEEALTRAPDTNAEFIKVPKVI